MAPSCDSRSHYKTSCSHTRDFVRHGCCVYAYIVIVALLLGQSYAVNAQRGSSAGSSSVTTSYACEGLRHLVVCPRGTVIYVLNASYGRISDMVCTSDPTAIRKWDLHCMSQAAFGFASKMCEGQRTCVVTFDAEAQGRRCPSDVPISADNGLTITNVCGVPGSVTPNATAWWLSRTDTTSRPVLSSLSGEVGDDDDETLSLSSSPVRPTAKAIVTAASIEAATADDRRQDISSPTQPSAPTTSHSGTAAGDGKGSSSVTTSYSCEGLRHLVVCPRGTVIHVLNASYGRISDMVCTSDPKASREWDLHCMSQAAFGFVGNMCEGQRTCVVTFDAEAQGRRCPSAVPISADIGLTITNVCGVPGSVTPNATGPGHLEEAGSRGVLPDDVTGSQAEPSPTAAVRSSRVPASTSAMPITVAVTNSLVFSHRTTPGSGGSSGGGGRCPAERVRRISWPSTAGGRMVVAHCPRPARGRARRLCSVDGRWQETPDMSKCVSPAFTEALQQISSRGRM